MAKAKVYVRDDVVETAYEGTIDFDETDYDNNAIDLYNVVVVDPETDEYEKIERYTDYDSFRAAQYDVPGRKPLPFDEEESFADVSVVVNCWNRYDVGATIHTAYVTDTEED